MNKPDGIAGYVEPYAAVIIGFLGACSCNLFVAFKHQYGFDDALDVFGVHGVGGLIGNLLTGVFASRKMVALNGTSIPGGWVDGHFMQVLYQLAASLAALAWSFFVTYLILWIMNKIPSTPPPPL
jgi:Amt family ammonium transporter